MANPRVSIICNTYNHEKYIKDALESFINQKTNFDYEILVHDDASTDNTVNIVKEYEKKYPDLIKTIFQNENKYSKGVSIMDIQLQRAKGKYLACCEGDEYWIDFNKLQLQYDILEKNSEINMVAHGVFIVKEDTKKVIGKITPSENERILNLEEVIAGGGGYIGTNSLFFRKSLLIPKPPLRKKMELDYTLQIVGALKGGIYYVPKVMSAYRSLSKGSWSVSMYSDVKKFVIFQDKMIDMLEFLNDSTNNKYEVIIRNTIKKTEFNKYLIMNDIKSLKSDKFKDLYYSFPLSTRIKIYIKKYLPFLKKIKDNFLYRGKKQ